MFAYLFKEEARKLFFEEDRHWSKTYLVMGIFCFTGAIGKIDIFTDMAMIVELFKCAERDGSIEDRLTAKGWLITILACITFGCTLLYQVSCFLRLIFKTRNEDSFSPITSHITTLLMCSDYKMLGM